MAAPRSEQVRTVERHIKKIERTIAQLRIGFQKVKREVERQAKGGLKAWLTLAPKLPRSAENAFMRISSGTNRQQAFDVIDRAMASILALQAEMPLFGVTGSPSDVNNIFTANAFAREDAVDMIEDLELPVPLVSEQSILIGGVIADNRFNIFAIPARDGRHLKESMTRAVTGEQPIAQINTTINNWHINDGFYDLATLAHPRATVRGLMYESAKEGIAKALLGVASLGALLWTVFPRERGFSSRVDKELSYKIFSTNELTRKFNNMTKQVNFAPDWRGLGLGFNSDELFVPIFKEQEEDAKEWSKEQRKGLIK